MSHNIICDLKCSLETYCEPNKERKKIIDFLEKQLTTNSPFKIYWQNPSVLIVEVVTSIGATALPLVVIIWNYLID